MVAALAAGILCWGVSGAPTRLQAAAESGSTVDHWTRIHILRDRGDGPQALSLAHKALLEFPRSIALGTQMAELVLALEGPGTARVWVDSLDAAGAEIQAAVFRLALVGEYGDDGTGLQGVAQLRIGAAPKGLDALVLGYQEARHRFPRGGMTPEPAAVDSLLDWADRVSEAFVPTGPARNWIHCAYSGLPALADYSRGNTRSALETLSAAREESALRGLAGLELEQSIQIGIMAVRRGLTPAGTAGFLRALGLAKRLGNRHQESVALSFLGYLAENQRETAAALQYYAEAAGLFRQLGNERGLGWSLMGAGWVHWLRGEIILAEQNLQEGYRVFVETDDSLGQARALLNLGVVYTSTERPDEALRVYEMGLELAEQINHAAERSRFLNNIANLHFLNGRSERCLPYYRQALELAKSAGNRRETARILNNLALVSGALGHREQTITYHEEAVRIAREAGDRPQEAAYLEQLAAMLIRIGQPEEAAPHLDLALDLAGGMDDWLLQGNLAETRGFLLAAREDWPAAIEAFERADAIFSGQHHAAGRLRFLGDLAWARAEAGNLREALHTADLAGTLADLRRETAQQAVYRGLKAHLQLRFGDPELGWKDCEDALDLAIRARLETRALRFGHNSLAGFRPQLRGNLLLAILLELARNTTRLDQPEFRLEAFGWLQQQKARSLLELVEPTRAFFQPSAPEDLLARLRHSRLELENLTEELREFSAAATSDSLRLALAEGLTRYDEILTEVMAADPRYAGAHRRQVITVPEVQRWIDQKPGLLILDFLVPPAHKFDPEMRAFLIAWDSRGLRIHPLPPVDELSGKIGFFLDLMEAGAGRDLGPGVRAACSALFETLLGPVAEQVRTCDELIIAPDGPVHTVPFAALLHLGSGMPSPPPLTITPSLSVLRTLEKRADTLAETPARYDLGIWSAEKGVSGESPANAPHLQFAGHERRALEQSVPNHAVFPGPGSGQSARTTLQEAGILGRSRILHFIAHGSFDDARPWAATLQLWPEEAGSGLHRLATSDIYGLDFRAELVTLSACETARGQILVGEGMLGMAQAMFGAGAQSVLATLWSVDDASSAVFMSRMYDQLGRGVEKAEALRQVQVGFQSEPERAHPYYWAGYVLLGEAASGIKIRTRRPAGRTALLVGLGLVLVGLALRMR